MEDKSDTIDLRIDEIASRQHGVITLRQLEDVGLGRRGVSKRASSGRLHRVHRGVYAVGHRGLSLHGRFMAAVLACGEGAVLSHGSAAVLWKLLKPLDGPVHVSVLGTSGRKKRQGIHLHRCQALAEPSPSPTYPQQGGGRGRRLLTTRRENIPVTSVGRTIEDLRRNAFPPRLLRRAIRQAELMGHRLDGIESDRTRSDLETYFLALCRHHGLSAPEVNVKLGEWEVDFLWRSRRLVVETDSWTYHRGSAAFQDDHARDLDLRAAGYTVLRFSELQLEEEPGRVAADVARALAVIPEPVVSSGPP
ncbi:MAG TPA: type IV toxin-antitoxin system AbiEi family antitoxin domain-containing protein [Solirubrobacterales bacterium]|nr:type IV toxin-antitoxin system AbiEi family antitoxin domain-containing protein [Solirubrobacterales bacterium]